ncbi:MAG: outer membrane biosynthesis protein TonB [Psychromonas sp.]|jgi:outer membrane biosynthesis protein TonB
MIAITLLSSVFVSFVELPELSREEKEKLPPQLVKIMKSKAAVKLPEIKPKPKKIEAESKPEPEPEPKPEPKPKPKPEPELKPKPKPEPKPQIAEKALDEKVQKSGLLALSEQLNAMRDIAKAVPSVAPTANGGLAEGNGTAAKTERIMLGNKVTGTSGSITGKRFSDVGEASKLASNQSGQVAQVATVVDEIAKQVEVTRAVERASGQRSSESIRQMFDRNKSAIYSIYRRALRSDPSLEGSVTVKLIILPDGSVSTVEIIASEIDIDNYDFAGKLLRRIRLINFGSKLLAETELEYTFNFLPF